MLAEATAFVPSGTPRHAMRLFAKPPNPMTELLERAVAEAASLSEAQQDAIAARILEEIRDEQAWDQRFAATTDEQWDKLAAMARREIEAEGSTPLDELIRGQRD